MVCNFKFIILAFLLTLHCGMQCPTVLCAASNNSSCIWYAMPQIVWTTSNACPMFFTFQTPKCRLSELSFSVGSTLIDSSCQHLTAITVGPHGVRSTGTGACIPHGVGNVQQSKFITLPVNCMYYNCILYIRMYYKQSLQKIKWCHNFISTNICMILQVCFKKCNQNKPVDQNCF